MNINSYLLIMTWMVGIVIANGFISTLSAILFPPWALYLSAEQLWFYLQQFIGT